MYLDYIFCLFYHVSAGYVRYSEGKLHIAMRKGRSMYYLREKSTDHTGKYISVRDEHTLGIFLQKSYDEKVLKLIRQEIAVLEVMVIR